MASRPTHDALATVGEYTSNDGTKKKRYVKCGTLFKHDDGGLSLKLDSIPVGPGWTGWLSFFEIKRDAPPQDSGTHAEPRNLNIPSNRDNAPRDTFEDDEIPF